MNWEPPGLMKTNARMTLWSHILKRTGVAACLVCSITLELGIMRKNVSNHIDILFPYLLILSHLILLIPHQILWNSRWFCLRTSSFGCWPLSSRSGRGNRCRAGRRRRRSDRRDTVRASLVGSSAARPGSTARGGRTGSWCTRHDWRRRAPWPLKSGLICTVPAK